MLYNSIVTLHEVLLGRINVSIQLVGQIMFMYILCLVKGDLSPDDFIMFVGREKSKDDPCLAVTGRSAATFALDRKACLSIIGCEQNGTAPDNQYCLYYSLDLDWRKDRAQKLSWAKAQEQKICRHLMTLTLREVLEIWPFNAHEAVLYFEDRQGEERIQGNQATVQIYQTLPGFINGDFTSILLLTPNNEAGTLSLRYPAASVLEQSRVEELLVLYTDFSHYERIDVCG